MPVRLRITLLFTILVVVILGLVCTSIFYFFSNSRSSAINNRLTKRAITVSRLLSQREIFTHELIQRIDSSTAFVVQRNVIQAYDESNRKIYSYSSVTGDTLTPSAEKLASARSRGKIFYEEGSKEVVAYYHAPSGMVVFAAGNDVEGKGTASRLLQILIIAFVVGCSLTAVSGYFFSARLLRPLSRIADDVKDISAYNLSRRIESGNVKDEWNYLSTTLNDLLNRLQESFDIQKRFISNASHELSTPLTSISSQIEVSLQRERSAGEYKQVLQSVHQDVVHMNNLTQTLLQFAKASGSPGGLEIALVRIDEVLLRLPYEVAKANKGYTVQLMFDALPADEAQLLVFGNEDLLFTAIRNLVFNACKYSINHTAEVKLVVQQDKVQVAVEDKGLGIPKEELPHIFQPFYRVNDQHDKEGFGLGLPLASRIINLHKGNIDVASELNNGSIFTITLPAAQAFVKQ